MDLLVRDVHKLSIRNPAASVVRLDKHAIHRDSAAGALLIDEPAEDERGSFADTFRRASRMMFKPWLTTGTVS